MKTFLRLLALGLLSNPVVTTGASATLHVVATLPDFAAIASAVGGDHLKVTSLAKGTEDAHFVDARPSFIRILNQADVLLHGGVDLEVGWLPPLLDNARNPRIQRGQPGNVIMAEGLELLEIPATPVDRSQGDVHPLGNPHFWLDPANGKIMAHHLADVFSRLDPDHASDYTARTQDFVERLDRKILAWSKTLEPLRGTRVLTYHKSFEYLARRFGLEIVGQLEPKPGIEPSPTHIQNLIERTRLSPVKFVILEPFRPRRTAETLATALGAKVLILPVMVGGVENVKDYPALFDYAVAQLTDAAR